MWVDSSGHTSRDGFVGKINISILGMLTFLIPFRHLFRVILANVHADFCLTREKCIGNTNPEAISLCMMLGIAGGK